MFRSLFPGYVNKILSLYSEQIYYNSTRTIKTTKMTNKKLQGQNSKKILTPCQKVSIDEKEKQAFTVFTDTLQLYRPDEVMVSFNGGKDCTVVLHLLAKFYSNTVLSHLRIPVLYIESRDSFPEIEQFVAECAQRYQIDLIVRRGGLKQALEELCAEMPQIKAVFMGCRRGDPHCGKLMVMQATDSDWPPLMRVSPIVNWSHRDVWNYIMRNNVPYCSLYDKGYTSIGNMKNTQPNPHLKCVCPQTGEVYYKPAYELPDDDSLERAGRY